MSCSINNTACRGSINNCVFGWYRPSQMPAPLPCPLCDYHLQRVSDRYGGIRPCISGATVDNARENLLRILGDELPDEDLLDEKKVDIQCATCTNDAVRLCRHRERLVCSTCWYYNSPCCGV